MSRFQTNRFMPVFSTPIRIKIFGVASTMLALLLGVSYVNYRNIALVNGELIDLAYYLTPLTEDVALINVHALEQEIHYERMVRLLETEPMDKELFAAERAKFEKRGALVDQELKEAIALADKAIHHAQTLEDALEFARVQPLLEILEVDHQRFQDHSAEVLTLFKTGEREKAKVLDEQLEQFEQEFDQRIQSVLFELGAFTEAAALDAKIHEQKALNLSWVLAAIATVVGLAIASIITLGLVRPLRRLVDSTQELEHGNLTARVPVTSQDEVGVLSQTFNAMVTDIQAKEHLKATFGQYVDPRIVERLMTQPGETNVIQRQEMTVFFSDMAGFSTISELLTPTGLVTLINQYLTLASEPILAHDGVIDKFIGDAVTAFWGAPFVTDDNHAKLACYAALEQLSQLVKLRRLLPDIMGIRKGLPDIQIRIGLATGDLVASNIGAEHAQSYTVLGQPVQIAEYLESTNKQYGTTILLTAATRRAAADAIETREIDRIQLPGQADVESIYELLDTTGNLTAQQEELRDRFETALQEYRQQHWDIAQKNFEACLAVDPSDKPSQLYLKRIHHLQHYPPTKEWNGVWSGASLTAAIS